MRSPPDGERYRRRLVVLIIVTTGMVCVKLVASSWKGSPDAAKASRVGQATSAPATRRTH